MLHRIVAHMLFPSGSGLASWCQAQMAVRYAQAQMIRPGQPDAEHPRNMVSGDRFSCDVALADKPAAVDALTTLQDVNVLGRALPLGGPEPSPSFVEYHLCDHDETVRTGCQIVARYETSVTSGPEPWVQPQGAHDAYPQGAEVTHDGQTWRSTIDANVWAPGVYGWETV